MINYRLGLTSLRVTVADDAVSEGKPAKCVAPDFYVTKERETSCLCRAGRSASIRWSIVDVGTDVNVVAGVGNVEVCTLVRFFF